MGTPSEGTSRYEIVVRGALSRAVTHSLGDVEAARGPEGTTRLLVRVRDQGDLRAVLAQLADLAIELRSLRRLPDGDGADGAG